MADELTEAERAELEQLRAEKAAQQEAAQAARDRAELQRLKEERALAAREAEAIKREAALREQGRKFMEPDEDDLNMPMGQKIVLAVIALLVLMIVVSHFLK